MKEGCGLRRDERDCARSAYDLVLLGPPPNECEEFRGRETSSAGQRKRACGEGSTHGASAEYWLSHIFSRDNAPEPQQSLAPSEPRQKEGQNLQKDQNLQRIRARPPGVYNAPAKAL